MDSEVAFRALLRDRGTRSILVAAAVVVVAVIAIGLLPANDRGEQEVIAIAPSPHSPLRSATRPPSPSPAPTPADVFPTDWVEIGRRFLTVEGIPFSYAVQTSGWSPYGSLLVSKSSVGPQGAEAVIFWTGWPDGTDADPCGYAADPLAGSAADIAAGLARAPGTERITGPSDVTVGGRAATQVVLTVRADVGCDPGFFYNWKAQTGGPMWVSTRVGDTMRVWIVDVDGALLFIEGETNQDAGSDLEREIQQIVDSIRFE
jgi:hypothetical protein